MIGDSYNKVSGVTTPTGQVITAALSTVSEDSIDLLANKDIGLGRGITAVVNFVLGLVSTRVGASATVVVATDVCTLASHGLQTGSPLILVTATTITTGFTLGRVYYAVPLTSSTFKLATTLTLALAGTPDVDFGAADGSFTFTAIPELEVQVIAANTAALSTEIQVLATTGKVQGRVAQPVVIGTNVITYPVNDPLPEGTPVTIAGTLTGSGLTAGTYYACNTSTSNFALALTRADAMAASPVTVACVVGTSSGVTFTIADGMLGTSGPQLLLQVNPMDGIPGRYLGLRYLSSSSLSQATVAAQIGLIAIAVPKVYPSGFAS